MPTLGQFLLDPVAMRDGEWIDATGEYAGIRVLTRGLTGTYADKRAEKMKVAARQYGGEDQIPQAVKNRIDIETLCEVCLLDIEGLTHPRQPDGTPGAALTIAEFKAIVVLEEASDLAIMAFKCAQRVGQKAKLQAELAEKN